MSERLGGLRICRFRPRALRVGGFGILGFSFKRLQDVGPEA